MSDSSHTCSYTWQAAAYPPAELPKALAANCMPHKRSPHSRMHWTGSWHPPGAPALPPEARSDDAGRLKRLCRGVVMPLGSWAPGIICSRRDSFAYGLTGHHLQQTGDICM